MTGAETIKVDELVRALVKGSSGKNGHSSENPQDPSSEEVLFDLDVDGARYLLIRLPQVGPHCTVLSPREQEIVRLVALGHSNKIIAGVLNISSWTVCTHVRRIFTKLGVASRAAMVARASDLERMRGLSSNQRDSPLTETISRRPMRANSHRLAGA